MQRKYSGLKTVLADKFRQLFSLPVDDMELVRAQFRAFAKQVPLLYFILIINTLAVAFTFAKFGHPWISVYLPVALCVVCLVRGVTWWRMRDAEIPDEEAIAHMRRANRLAFTLAISFTVWGFTLFSYGDAYAQSQIVFFLALTMISCAFCLMHLRSAVLSVTIVGVIPFSLFFSFADHGHFQSAAVNLALASIGMIAILLTYNRDFANLVASRRSLVEKQAETQRLSDENLRLANIDSLSGLPNRRAVMSKLAQWQAESHVYGSPIAVVFIDLDGFKDVNDAYGHETGDMLIRIVTSNIENLLPDDAILARLGGDEFAALISRPDAERLAEGFAARVVRSLYRPIRIGDRSMRVGASVGIACASPRECDAQELFRRADTAMYYVKANGGAGIKIYAAELDAERQSRQDLEEEIRRGLHNDEFDVLYQPIISASSGEIVAVEALLRWPGRPDGQVGPDQFIPVAEASGLINRLGLFALRRACEDILKLDAIRLSVNVSPAQFRDPDFELNVSTVLMETGFPAERLELELTEGYLIDHPERAEIAISSLKGMGISVALDDFGTGYTSIAYLQRYGFNRIKIDKSLASRITINRKAATLVSGVINLANGLDMAVTAEGVESEDQAAMLRLAGCQCLQGFWFSTPKPLDQLLAGGAGKLCLGDSAA
jgi:diguanylate cyclase (GGDEF)-like protein